MKKRAMRSLNRKRMLKALPPAAEIRVNDPEYKTNQFNIASLHFHDDLYSSFERKANGVVALPDSIPSTMAKNLTNKGCQFTTTDQHDDGSYVPLPNVARNAQEGGTRCLIGASLIRQDSIRT